MKSLTILIAILCLSFAVASPEVGDRKSQKEVFGTQLTWEQLSSKDSFRRMKISDYIPCQVGDQIICWNAIEDGMAEVQIFSPDDSILVVKHEGKEYLHKAGCKNRMKYIRIVKPEPITLTPAPPVKPATVVVADTIRKTIIVEEEVVRVQRRSGYTIQGAYQTQGSYRVGGYCPPTSVYYAPPPPRRYYPPPPPRCQPKPQPKRNTYYGPRRIGG